MIKITNETINFLIRMIDKKKLEIKKINEYLNEWGATYSLRGHLIYRKKLMKQIIEINKEIKELTNEI